jgi:predicted metal-dependent hydrolase
MESPENASVRPDFCEGALHPQAVLGFELFNHGRFFESHEALETAWREEPGPVREMYRGILQVAVAYLHIERKNYIGAIKMFRRCHPWLDPLPASCRGVNLSLFKKDYKKVEEAIRRLGPHHISNFDMKMMQPIEWHITSGQSINSTPGT